MKRNLAVRWTIGDVSDRGLKALVLSVGGVTSLFGHDATYAVSVNSIETEIAQQALGDLSARVLWHRAEGRAPPWLMDRFLDEGWAEGVAWKFAPVRLYPDKHELSLDNDVILWDVPHSIEAWLQDGDSCLIAEDVRPAFGIFTLQCPGQGRNSGIRGLPAGFDLEREMRHLLERSSVRLTSELDEQGLQVAILSTGKHHVVTLDEVTICSPIPPHVTEFGRCGAHFVGLNAKKLPWEWNGKSGEQYIEEHWDTRLDELTRRVARLAVLENV